MNKNSAVSALVLALVAIATALLASSPEAAPPADGPRIDQVLVQDVDTFVTATGAPLDRMVTIEGANFFGTAFGPFVSFRMQDGSEVEAAVVILEDEGTIVAYPPGGTRGTTTVIVTNPDRETVTRITTL